MMKKDAAIAILAAAITLLLVTLRSAGPAAGQPQPPVLSVYPSSGPCDGTVEVAGTGFEPGSEVPLDLAGPHSDIAVGRLAVATPGPDGQFKVSVTFGSLGCEAAARDTEVDDPGEPKHLGIFAGYDETRLFVITRAVYHYTTTTPSVPRVLPSAGDGGAMERHLRVPEVNAGLAGAGAQPQPTLVLSPSSGPCNASLEVNGSGFDRSRLVTEGPGPALYLLHPGADDISMGILNPVFIDQGGAFSEPVGLYQHGCEAAALDSQAEQPTGHLSIALSAGGPTVELGGRIPNIIAIAEYTYTTATPPPRPTMVVSPASGACDATVDVTGANFQVGQGISLKLRLPGAEDNVATLASVVTDAHGEFAVRVTLGELGCRAAQMYMTSRDPTQPQLYIVADPIPPPQQIGASLAFVVYTFTTTELSGGETVRTLPNTGTGPAAPVPLAWLSVAAVVAALGLTLIAAPLYHRRQRVRR